MHLGIIHLVPMQNFPENYHFLLSDVRVRIRSQEMLVFRKIANDNSKWKLSKITKFTFLVTVTQV